MKLFGDTGMLCFEVWRNDEKLATAGLGETGVLSFILTWVGHEPNASANAATTTGNIPGLTCRVGGLEGMTHFEWLTTDNLSIGDELRVRLISSPTSDPPQQSQTTPRGQPGWRPR